MRFFPLYRWLGVVFIGIFCSCAAFAEASLIRVIDGDTVLMIAEGQPFKLRLRNIDAPELHQAFGKLARQRLLEWCHGSTQVTIVSKDRYHRDVGDLFCEGEDAALYLVSQGLAWAGPRLSAHHPLKLAQNDAQQQGLGLWAINNPLPPWQWRKQFGRHDQFKN